MAVIQHQVRRVRRGLEAGIASEQTVAPARQLLAEAGLVRCWARSGKSHRTAYLAAILARCWPLDDFDIAECGIVDVVENGRTGSIGDRDVVQKDVVSQTVGVRAVPTRARVVTTDRDAGTAPGRSRLHEDAGNCIDRVLQAQPAGAIEILLCEDRRGWRRLVGDDLHPGKPGL